MNAAQEGAGSPRRGRPPLIGRAKIIQVAQGMAPESITMQAVADKLGVDRKTLRYHVTDRDGLMAMLAADAFQTALDVNDVSSFADWRDAVRAFATATRDGIIAMGGLAGYANFRGDSGLRDLAPAEAMLEALVDAGFADETAGRSLAFVAEFVFTSGRNSLSKAAEGQHPQTRELRAALAHSAGSELGALKKVVEAEDPFDDRQFEFDLRLVILGMERLLAEDLGEQHDFV